MTENKISIVFFAIKINTLENIDELNRFYENIFVSETSLLPAPTSVIEYMKSIGKVSYDKRNTKLIDYLTINKIKPEITGLALKEHNYKYMDEPFKRILFQEHILNSYPDIQFELENEQISKLEKISFILTLYVRYTYPLGRANN